MRRTRYALTVVLCLFALGTLGYYYAYASDERLPPFKLETIEGDAKEAAAMELSGSYGGRMESKFLTVTTEGSEYQHPDNMADAILDSRSWLLDAPGLKEIRREHPNFMRGKSSMSGWYADEERLVYADAAVEGGPARTARLNVELLNLKSGKTSRFSLSLPDAGYDFVFVNDVQWAGAQLHVLVGQRKLEAASDSSPTEYWDDVLDLANGKMVDRKELTYDLKTAPGAFLQAVMVTEERETAPSAAALLQVDEITQKRISENVATDVKFLSEKLYSYSYSTGELKELSSPFVPGDAPGSVFHTLSGNVVTSLRHEDADSLAWTRTDLATGKQSNAIQVEAGQLGATDIGSSFAADGRIYALLNSDPFQATEPAKQGSDTMAAVLDAASGKVLYRGKVVSADPKRDAGEALAQLRLNNLTRHE